MFGLHVADVTVLCLTGQRLPSSPADRKEKIRSLRAEFKIVSELSSPHLIKYLGIEMQKVRLSYMCHSTMQQMSRPPLSYFDLPCL